MAKTTKGSRAVKVEKVEGHPEGPVEIPTGIVVGGHYRTSRGYECIAEAETPAGWVVRRVGTRDVACKSADSLTAIPESEWMADEVKAPASRTRDARLPAVGTPITRTWRGHECRAVEQVDGSFSVSYDGKEIGSVTSLRFAADAIFRAAGKNPGNNTSGIPWWGLSGNTMADLERRIRELESRRAAAEDRLHGIEAELETAKTARA